MSSQLSAARLYKPKVPLLWWLSRRSYTLFVVRELSSVFVALTVVSLAFVLLHAVTFVNLTPQAVVLKVRGRRVPGRLLAGSLYLTWLLVSAFIAWLVVS